MNLSVRSGNVIRVAMPKGYTIQQAKSFVLQQKEWIEKQKAKFGQQNLTLVQNGYQTHFHTFAFHACERNDIQVRIHAGICSIFYPSFLEESDPPVQKASLSALKSIYRLEAKKYLPERLNYLSNLHQLPYKELVIKDIRSKWGSCSASKNINLSLHLMKLPKRLIDFVILHELTHTIEMNHGPAFKARLNSLCGGNLLKFSRELKLYKI